MKYSREKVIASIKANIEQALNDRAEAVLKFEAEKERIEAKFQVDRSTYLVTLKEWLESDNPDIEHMPYKPGRDSMFFRPMITFGNNVYQDFGNLDYHIAQARKMVKNIELLAGETVDFSSRTDPINSFTSYL